jgi:hypothetical protein
MQVGRLYRLASRHERHVGEQAAVLITILIRNPGRLPAFRGQPN